MVGNCSVYNDDGTWKGISCSDDLSIKVWDLSERSTGKSCISTIHGHTDVIVECIPFYNDQRKRWNGVSCSWDGTVRVWDLSNGVQERELTDPDWPNCEAVLSCPTVPSYSRARET